MTVPEPLPARLIGALFVERGLVSESQIRVALEIQRETGQQLGQLLVERFGVSRKELASVVAEQWAKLGGTSGPEDTASWRRLGEIFVERGFVSEDELEQALTRQRQTGERLGEALVAQGVISKFELAGALAEQMASLEDMSGSEPPPDQLEATVHHLPTRAPDPAEIPFGTVVDVEPADEPALTAHDAVEFVTADGPGVDPEAEDVASDIGEYVGDIAFAAPYVPAPLADVVHDSDSAVESVEPVEPVEPVESVEPVGPVGPVETIAIDDVGHVSLLGTVPVPEAEPSETEADPSPFQLPEAEAEPSPAELPEAEAEAEPSPTDPSGAELPALFDDLREAILADVSPLDETRGEPLVSAACLAFAPTTEGYRLVVLDRLPEPGETVTVPDVGERLVLRIGRSPIPGDDRVCAYVEEPVTPAPVVALAH